MLIGWAVVLGDVAFIEALWKQFVQASEQGRPLRSEDLIGIPITLLFLGLTVWGVWGWAWFFLSKRAAARVGRLGIYLFDDCLVVNRIEGCDVFPRGQIGRVELVTTRAVRAGGQQVVLEYTRPDGDPRPARVILSCDLPTKALLDRLVGWRDQR